MRQGMQSGISLCRLTAVELCGAIPDFGRTKVQRSWFLVCADVGTRTSETHFHVCSQRGAHNLPPRGETRDLIRNSPGKSRFLISFATKLFLRCLTSCQTDAGAPILTGSYARQSDFRLSLAFFRCLSSQTLALVPTFCIGDCVERLDVV